MILINLKKINTNLKEFYDSYSNISKNKVKSFQKILEDYSDMINLPNLECPNCHSHELIRWGSYTRGVIFCINKQSNDINSGTIKIQRVRCNKCGKTHALLPIGIIPYKQITVELMNEILLYIVNTSIEKTAVNFSFHCSHIKKIWKDFNVKHLPYLVTLLRSRNLQYLIQSISESLDLQIQYIISCGCCFMQTKLGCLGI